MPTKKNIHAIIHSSELLTGAGIRSKDGRRPTESDLGQIRDGALVYEELASGAPGQILWVGPSSALPTHYRKAKIKNLRKKQALLPGLIDCHTHLVFAGDRADEFALRSAGVTYEEIARSGGGIQKTVLATRQASERELFRLAQQRLKLMRSFGVRVIEIKSGYGLDLETELKCLRVTQLLKKNFPDLLIVSTYMGAHDFPKDIARSDYIKEIIGRHLPTVARLKLAEQCDVFVDRGYYTLTEAEQILTRAKELKLSVKLHADELSDTGSAAFASKIGALSADHLLKISKNGIRGLSTSQTTAVLLPGTALYLKTAAAPARSLISAGARVAIATDFNPGSCPCPSLPAMLTLSALHMGMSRAELFAAVTYNAACALGLQRSIGTLEPGRRAFFTLAPGESFESLYYGLGY
jgi:imidazolonepropionase